MRTLPLSVLAVLGLSACRGCGKQPHPGPCLSVQPVPPEEDPVPREGDTATPCLSARNCLDVLACLEPLPTEVGVCLSKEAPPQEDPDMGRECLLEMGPCLSIAPPDPEPSEDGDQGSLDVQRESSLAAVVDRGVLPDDVARRCAKHSGVRL